MAPSGVGANDWAKKLLAAYNGRNHELPPPGWKTAEQIAIDMGKSRTHTNAMVAWSIKTGLLERKKYHAPCKFGQRRIWHYRWVESS